MATYGDFSSLLQLGVGLGIGLSLFRAPIDLRISRLDRGINGEIEALKGVDTDFAQTKRLDMMKLRFDFNALRSELDHLQIPFMVSAVLSAALNFIALIVATVDKDRIPGSWEYCGLLAVSVVSYLTIIAMLEIVARVKMGKITKEFTAIRGRRSSMLAA